MDQGKCWNVFRIERMVSDVSTMHVNQPKSVSLSMFWGALLLLCIGIVLSLLLCLGEVAFFKYRGRVSSI